MKKIIFITIFLILLASAIYAIEKVPSEASPSEVSTKGAQLPHQLMTAKQINHL